MIPPQYSETPAVPPVYTYPAYPPQQQQQQVHTGLSPNLGQAYIVNQPAQVGYVNGCNQIFYTCSPAPVVYNEYKSGQSKFLGVAQILIGIMCIAFNAAVIGLYYWHYYEDLGVVSYGIWGGIFFIITGSFGVAAGKRKTRGFIITFMVLCIISAAVAVVILILSAITISGVASECYTTSRNYYGSFYYWYSYWYCPEGHSARLAMHSLLIILSVFEGVFVLWGSINCCKVACCGAKRQNTYNVQPQPVTLGSMNGNPQLIILTAPNVMSQPIPNAGYSVATAPMYQTVQPAATNMGGIDSNSEGKTNTVFQLD